MRYWSLTPIPQTVCVANGKRIKLLPLDSLTAESSWDLLTSRSVHMWKQTFPRERQPLPHCPAVNTRRQVTPRYVPECLGLVRLFKKRDNEFAEELTAPVTWNTHKGNEWRPSSHQQEHGSLEWCNHQGHLTGATIPGDFLKSGLVDSTGSSSKILITLPKLSKMNQCLKAMERPHWTRARFHVSAPFLPPLVPFPSESTHVITASL